MINTIQLLLIGFLALFYELVFIRWLPASITSIAYFSNIVLISCFLGLGLGCLVSKRKIDLFKIFPFLIVVITTLFVLFRNLDVTIPPNSGEWIWSSYRGNILYLPNLKIGIAPALIIIFSLNTLLFIPVGQKMGRLMGLFSPLKAYTINILGSILGIVGFSLFSFFYNFFPLPISWFIVGGIIIFFFFIGERKYMVSAIIATLLLWIVIGLNSRGEIWSPYYDIQLKKQPNKGVAVYVNKFFHQEAIDFQQEQLAREKYSIPYKLKIPGRLLILGAGTGNDAAIANMYGVKEIDAVEIDPVIYKIGKALHPLKPYNSTNIHMYIDDARSFLKRTDKRYDMIILGTLDSHALLRGMSTVRLDNFVYTIQCMNEIKGRLADDGIAVLMFSVPTQWLGNKLLKICYSVFPGCSYLAKINDAYLFNLMVIAGPGAKESIEMDPGYKSQFLKIPELREDIDLPTDDWPYLYLVKRGIPIYYLKVISILFLISTAAILILSPERSKKINYNFFFLGCAFLLLETKSVTTLSLLFGSTWIVNSFVFLAILIMILLANLTVLKVRIERIGIIYISLFLSLLLNYYFPLEIFLGQSFWIKSFIPAFVIALPIYFAGIIFARLFKMTKDVGMVYGSNLIGCVLGGLLEYSSMLAGLKFLFLLAGLFYFLSMIATKKVSYIN